MHLYTPPKPPTSIPIIDVGGSSSEAAEAIHRACRETGFFYVSNHGVDQSLIDRQFDFAKKFFDLPIEEKEKLNLKKNPAAVGYAPIGGQKLDSQDTTKAAAPPDLKESIFWGKDVPPDHPNVLARYRGWGRNVEPPIAGYREQMESYASEMWRLGDDLLELIALSLQLDASWFKPFYVQKCCNLRAIKYPPHVENAEFNQLGAGAHTDWGSLTLLAQDDIGGLEIRNVAGDWIMARPVPGTFVVNIGDLMTRWTNGLYMSNMHRVKNNATTRDRYSLPFFYDPDPKSVIEAIPTCVTPDNPKRFATCTANEHSADMFERSYGYRPSTSDAPNKPPGTD